jgi:hypothetical protein
MKTKKLYLALMVFTAILYIPAYGDIQLIQRDEPRVNPALVGIEQIYVFTVQCDSEPNKDGLVWKELDGKVELRLKEAGIKIAPIRYPGGRSVIDHNIPQLRVYVEMLRPSDSQQYVFHIQTNLVSSVSLVKRQAHTIKADIWKTGPAMQAVSLQDMPAKVTDVVLQQIEAFIRAYRIANPEDSPPQADVNVTVPKEILKAPSQKPVTEYKYVASKNSRVFHKPDCRWAKNISPKNLVSYNSREEAIEDGKKPCSTCKP